MMIQIFYKINIYFFLEMLKVFAFQKTFCMNSFMISQTLVSKLFFVWYVGGCSPKIAPNYDAIRDMRVGHCIINFYFICGGKAAFSVVHLSVTVFCVAKWNFLNVSKSWLVLCRHCINPRRHTNILLSFSLCSVSWGVFVRQIKKMCKTILNKVKYVCSEK